MSGFYKRTGFQLYAGSFCRQIKSVWHNFRGGTENFKFPTQRNPSEHSNPGLPEADPGASRPARFRSSQPGTCTYAEWKRVLSVSAPQSGGLLDCRQRYAEPTHRTNQYGYETGSADAKRTAFSPSKDEKLSGSSEKHACTDAGSSA